MTFSQRFRVPAPKLICNNGALTAKSQVSSNSQLPLAACNRSWTLSNLFTLAWMHLRFLTRRQYTNEYFLITTCITCVLKPPKSYKWHISMDIESIHCRPVTPHKRIWLSASIAFQGWKVSRTTPTHEWFVKSYQKNPSKLNPFWVSLTSEKKKTGAPGSPRRQTGHNKSPIFKCKVNVMCPESHPRSGPVPFSTFVVASTTALEVSRPCEHFNTCVVICDIWDLWCMY